MLTAVHLGRFSLIVAMSVCLSVCPCHHKTPNSECRGELWLKNVFLKLACTKKSKKKGAFIFSQNFFNYFDPNPSKKKKN